MDWLLTTRDGKKHYLVTDWSGIESDTLGVVRGDVCKLCVPTWSVIV